MRTHYGIPALSVTFSPDKVRVFVPQDAKDSFTTLECDTKDMHAAYASKWWKPRGRLTTMFAVATSGAAVSPAMGRFRIGPTSMLLTFANARLGVWLPNPRYVNQIEWKGHRSFPKTRLGYLFKEFFGIHDPTDAFLYVTDGGHWENTGLVELLRLSDYDEIVCIDADQGPADRVKALAQAVDLAELECDVDINIDLDALRATRGTGGGPPRTPAARSRSDWCTARTARGVLWYAKPALTKDMPTQLLAHREVRQDFPRTSTLNQFFDTSTFFAYRDLGRYNAWQIRRARKHLRDGAPGQPDVRGLQDGDGVDGDLRVDVGRVPALRLPAPRAPGVPRPRVHPGPGRARGCRRWRQPHASDAARRSRCRHRRRRRSETRWGRRPTRRRRRRRWRRRSLTSVTLRLPDRSREQSSASSASDAAGCPQDRSPPLATS